MALLDQMEYLPDDLLAKVDRASMWASLEARVPLLDHEVVAFSWTLPDHLKVHEDGTKWPLRRLVERYLPAELMTRPKMGFTVPIEGWLREDLADWMGDRLHPEGLARRGLYDLKAVAGLRSAFEGGRGDLALPLWTLAVLEDWADRRGVTFG
jgi:asparagine synthase (glutamine-hydrolysing)